MSDDFSGAETLGGETVGGDVKPCSIQSNPIQLLKIYNHSHVRRKKDGVLWSTNEKVIELNKFTP